jgi:hypothetical protein
MRLSKSSTISRHSPLPSSQFGSVWVPAVFTKNRDRLLDADAARKFLAELMKDKKLRALLSDEHLSVDGTKIAAWASMKSFKAKDGYAAGPGRNGERDFHHSTI